MNLPIRLFALVVCISPVWWLAGCASRSDAGTGDRSPQSAGQADDAATLPKLEKGMTAEVIRQKLGEPVAIEPMKSPDGKAEVWVYRFEKSLGMTQVAAATRDVPVMSVSGTGPVMTTVKEPVYTLAERKSVVFLSLLMFDGQLAAQKARVEYMLNND